MQESQSSYGHYEGTQGYHQPPYDGGAGPSASQQVPPTSSMYDDEFVDAFAQRLSQRMAQGPRGKVYTQHPRQSISAGMRLALAIVSVVMLVPLSGIAIGLIAASHLWLVGVLALGAAFFTILVINIVFNNN